MNVYICYDRYERDEWYSVYHIETNKNRAIKHFREVDLIDFLSYGPDDCHSFVLQQVIMTAKQYHRLCYLVENEGNHTCDTSDELKDLLISIYDESEFDVYTLMSTDGCTDNFELLKFYCVVNGLDPENYDNINDAQDALYDDEDLYLIWLKRYIALNY